MASVQHSLVVTCESQAEYDAVLAKLTNDPKVVSIQEDAAAKIITAEFLPYETEV